MGGNSSQDISALVKKEKQWEYKNQSTKRPTAADFKTNTVVDSGNVRYMSNSKNYSQPKYDLYSKNYSSNKKVIPSSLNNSQRTITGLNNVNLSKTPKSKLAETNYLSSTSQLNDSKVTTQSYKSNSTASKTISINDLIPVSMKEKIILAMGKALQKETLVMKPNGVIEKKDTETSKILKKLEIEEKKEIEQRESEKLMTKNVKSEEIPSEIVKTNFMKKAVVNEKKEELVEIKDEFVLDLSENLVEVKTETPVEVKTETPVEVKTETPVEMQVEDQDNKSQKRNSKANESELNKSKKEIIVQDLYETYLKQYASNQTEEENSILKEYKEEILQGYLHKLGSEENMSMNTMNFKKNTEELEEYEETKTQPQMNKLNQSSEPKLQDLHEYIESAKEEGLLEELVQKSIQNAQDEQVNTNHSSQRKISVKGELLNGSNHRSDRNIQYSDQLNHSKKSQFSVQNEKTQEVEELDACSYYQEEENSKNDPDVCQVNIQEKYTVQKEEDEEQVVTDQNQHKDESYTEELKENEMNFKENHHTEELKENQINFKENHQNLNVESEPVKDNYNTEIRELEEEYVSSYTNKVAPYEPQATNPSHNQYHEVPSVVQNQTQVNNINSSHLVTSEIKENEIVPRPRNSIGKEESRRGRKSITVQKIRMKDGSVPSFVKSNSKVIESIPRYDLVNEAELVNSLVQDQSVSNSQTFFNQTNTSNIYRPSNSGVRSNQHNNNVMTSTRSNTQNTYNPPTIQKRKTESKATKEAYIRYESINEMKPVDLEPVQNLRNNYRTEPVKSSSHIQNNKISLNSFLKKEADKNLKITNSAQKTNIYQSGPKRKTQSVMRKRINLSSYKPMTIVETNERISFRREQNLRGSALFDNSNANNYQANFNHNPKVMTPVKVDNYMSNVTRLNGNGRTSAMNGTTHRQYPAEVSEDIRFQYNSNQIRTEMENKVYHDERQGTHQVHVSSHQPDIPFNQNHTVRVSSQQPEIGRAHV